MKNILEETVLIFYTEENSEKKKKKNTKIFTLISYPGILTSKVKKYVCPCYSRRN